RYPSRTILIFALFHFENLKPSALHLNNSSSNDSSITQSPWNEPNHMAGNTGTLKSWTVFMNYRG
ncbi:hypothetical protein C0J52_06038, partial [Blattella germanica]